MITIRRLLILQLALCDITGGQVLELDESDKNGNLELLFIDASGRIVNANAPGNSIRLIKLTDAGRQKDIPLLQSEMIPYGDYEIQARLTGFQPIRRRIVIKKPYQIEVFGVTVAPIEGNWIGSVVAIRLVMSKVESSCNYASVISTASVGQPRYAKIPESKILIFEAMVPGRYVVVTHGNANNCPLYDLVISPEANQNIIPERLRSDK